MNRKNAIAVLSMMVAIQFGLMRGTQAQDMEAVVSEAFQKLGPTTRLEVRPQGSGRYDVHIEGTLKLNMPDPLAHYTGNARGEERMTAGRTMAAQVVAQLRETLHLGNAEEMRLTASEEVNGKGIMTRFSTFVPDPKADPEARDKSIRIEGSDVAVDLDEAGNVTRVEGVLQACDAAMMAALSSQLPQDALQEKVVARLDSESRRQLSKSKPNGLWYKADKLVSPTAPYVVYVVEFGMFTLRVDAVTGSYTSTAKSSEF